MKKIELAKDALEDSGFIVIGAYLSPVNDGYKKKVSISVPFHC